MRAALTGGFILGVAFLVPRLAFGAEPDVLGQEAEPASNPKTDEARALFLKGAEHVKAARWGEAVFAFEQSSLLHPHATTTFNIAACERAMGRYTRALVRLQQTLAESKARPNELAPNLVDEATAYLGEIDKALVRLTITVLPLDASIMVDGRPLSEHTLPDGSRVWMAGVAPPGPPRPVRSASVMVLLDAGTHIFTLTRKGHSDAVVNRRFGAGARANLRLEAATLPATLHVTSNVQRAIVTVDGADVGPVPVDVLRRAGVYRVVVKSPGYETYETDVNVNAGGEVSLRASMEKETSVVTKKWWFWTGAAAVVASGVLLTYALTRPEPSPRPYDGGTSGWVVYPQGPGLGY